LVKSLWSQNRTIPPSEIENLETALRQAMMACRDLNLTQARKLILQLVDSIEKDGIEQALSSGQLLFVDQLLANEMESVLLLHVSESRAELYEMNALFGRDVDQKFPKCSFHIQESGSCLAVGRATACVFHLMCVLDVALDSLSCAVGLFYSQKNWNTIIEQIETKIAKIDFATHGSTWKEAREYYAKLALQFDFFREAWRNHTAHGRAKYTEREAERIFDKIKDFMQDLAVRLAERP